MKLRKRRKISLAHISRSVRQREQLGKIRGDGSDLKQQLDDQEDRKRLEREK